MKNEYRHVLFVPEKRWRYIYMYVYIHTYIYTDIHKYIFSTYIEIYRVGDR